MKTIPNRRLFLAQSLAVAASGLVTSGSIAKSQVQATEHRVEIHQFNFVPEVIKIKPGDSVKWMNSDIVPHTATAVDRSWDTLKLVSNQSKVVKFDDSATLDYYCVYHPAMKGRIEIS